MTGMNKYISQHIHSHLSTDNYLFIKSFYMLKGSINDVTTQLNIEKACRRKEHKVAL